MVKMKVVVGVLLTLMLVTLGQAKSVRQTRQLKGSPQFLDSSQIFVGHQLEENVKGEEEVVDDTQHDPDWLPTAEDYEESYEDYDYEYGEVEDEDHVHSSEEEVVDDTKRDPDWLPTAEDYEESYEDDDYEYGAVEDEDHVHSSEEEVVDDTKHDPDWLPTAEDYEESYEDDDYEYDDVEDEDRVHSSEEVYDDDTDRLWSSDDDPDWNPVDNGYEDYDYGQDPVVDSADDPDWVPTEEDYEESYEYGDYDYGESDYEEDEEDLDARLDEVLFDIALLTAERNILDVNGPDQVLAIFYEIKNLNLTIDEAYVVLDQLREEEDDTINEIDHDYQESGGSQEQENQKADQTLVEIPAKLNQQTASVKSKRQTKSGGHRYQVQQIPDVGEIHQGNQVDSADIAVGVEPLSPQVDVHPYDVGSGVEAVDTEVASDSSSAFDWFHHGWGHVVDAAETVNDWGSDLVDKIQDVAADAADVAEDAAHSAGESIVSTYHVVRGNLSQLRQRIRNLFSRFSIRVQRGADYCIQHLGHAVNQVREAEILDKLQQKLAEGNQQVTDFFQLLGDKVTHWSHGNVDVDTGLITVYTDQTGEAVIQEGNEGQQAIPNLFQDQEVVVQLNQMVDSGVITQEELELLSQQLHQQQVDFQQENHYQQGHSPTIQIQSSRTLRSLIDSLKNH